MDLSIEIVSTQSIIHFFCGIYKRHRRIHAATSLLRKLWAGCGAASLPRILVVLAGSGGGVWLRSGKCLAAGCATRSFAVFLVLEKILLAYLNFSKVYAIIADGGSSMNPYRFVAQLLFAYLFASLPLLAQSVGVSRGELNRGQGSVDFQSYSGVNTVINSLAEIRGIGADLARQMLDSKGTVKRNVVIGDSRRYSVTQIVDYSSQDTGVIFADVFELGKKAGVDHINNLRQILAGYLEVMYKFSAAEADAIAMGVTVYNAIYRDNKAELSDRYAKAVLAKVSDKKLGLSPLFKDWPGGTQIVIPIELIGGVAEVAVQVILEDPVVAVLKTEKSKVDTAKMLREYKAREDAAQKAALKAKEDAEKLALAQERAAKEADEQVLRLQRSLAAAQEKVRTTDLRIRQSELDITAMQVQVDNARKDVVRNKFGVPVAGNDAAAAKEKELSIQQAALKKQSKTLEETHVEIENLQKQLEEAKKVALEKKAVLVR
ncbi:MAG: hypothetical protein Ta2A_02500 [Treponemataceae bacterium]|nr:MAG: hypothetical protein Ta2A_02500 [Treponemataceae bacterium]